MTIVMRSFGLKSFACLVLFDMLRNLGEEDGGLDANLAGLFYLSHDYVVAKLCCKMDLTWVVGVREPCLKLHAEYTPRVYNGPQRRRNNEVEVACLWMTRFLR